MVLEFLLETSDMFKKLKRSRIVYLPLFFFLPILMFFFPFLIQAFFCYHFLMYGELSSVILKG